MRRKREKADKKRVSNNGETSSSDDAPPPPSPESMLVKQFNSSPMPFAVENGVNGSSPRSPADEEEEGGRNVELRKSVSKRKAWQDKKWGMDPFVQCRIGRHSHFEERTGCVLSKKGDLPESYCNVDFHETAKNQLVLRRSPGDLGELIVECWHEGADRNSFIGGCHTPLEPFIRAAMEHDGWVPHIFDLGDHGVSDMDDEGPSRDAGSISTEVKWVPLLDNGKWQMDHVDRTAAAGLLRIRMLHGVDLRDVSNVKIKDVTSFADSSSLRTSGILFTLYILVALGFYTFHMRWNVLDTLVFVFTTFTTVGYGSHPDDFSVPGHDMQVAKLFTVFFIIIGIGIAGVAAGTLADWISVKLKTKKQQARLLAQKKLREHGHTIHFDFDDHAHHEIKKAADQEEEIRKSATPEAQGGHVNASVGQILSKKAGKLHSDPRAMQAAMAAAIMKHFWYDEVLKTFGALVTMGLIMFGGCCMYMLLEGLSFVDALYFTTVTASTVGYGDIAPQTVEGKVFTIFFVPVAVGMMSKTIMSIAVIPMEYRQLRLESFVLDQFGERLSSPDFTDLKQSIKLGPTDMMRKNDFTLAMLMRLGRVSKYDVARIEQVFFCLDKDGNGFIDQDDLVNLLQVQAQRAKRIAILEAEHFAGEAGKLSIETARIPGGPSLGHKHARAHGSQEWFASIRKEEEGSDDSAAGGHMIRGMPVKTAPGGGPAKPWSNGITEGVEEYDDIEENSNPLASDGNASPIINDGSTFEVED